MLVDERVSPKRNREVLQIFSRRNDKRTESQGSKRLCSQQEGVKREGETGVDVDVVGDGDGDGEYNGDDGDGGVTTQQRLATNESGQAVSNGNEGWSKEDRRDARKEDVDNKRRRNIYTI